MDDAPKLSRLAPEGGTPTAAQLREAFRQRQRAEEDLLQELERIADELPSVDRDQLRTISERLPPLAVVLDQGSVLGLLRTQKFVALRSRLQRQVHRLSLEERADSATVLELSEAIDRALGPDGPKNSEALAYLLRCVLENRRRHLAWVAEIVEQDLPLLAQDGATLREALGCCFAAAESLSQPCHAKR